MRAPIPSRAAPGSTTRGTPGPIRSSGDGTRRRRRRLRGRGHGSPRNHERTRIVTRIVTSESQNGSDTSDADEGIGVFIRGTH